MLTDVPWRLYTHTLTHWRPSRFHDEYKSLRSSPISQRHAPLGIASWSSPCMELVLSNASIVIMISLNWVFIVITLIAFPKKSWRISMCSTRTASYQNVLKEKVISGQMGIFSVVQDCLGRWRTSVPVYWKDTVQCIVSSHYRGV